MTRAERRPPAVSGLFYPSDEDSLRHIISEYLCNGLDDLYGAASDAMPYGVVCPHAGYVYSGRVAACSYGVMADVRPPYVMMVGPNHTGRGPALSLSGHPYWETPLGISPIWYPQGLLECGAIIDAQSHGSEHSLEVQLPMVQYVWGDISISPILMSDQSQETAERLGSCLARVVGADHPVFIASSDLTHYASKDVACDKDSAFIDAILQMDIDRLYNTMHDLGITACGYGAIAAAIKYCSARGATRGKLLKYDTSATASGDSSSVVGYCALAFY